MRYFDSFLMIKVIPVENDMQVIFCSFTAMRKRIQIYYNIFVIIHWYVFYSR